MKRLTFDGNFCDIAMCQETRGGSFCEDGYCTQRKVWERLKNYEDAEEQGSLIRLPCKVGDIYFIIRKYCDEHGELPYATEHWGSDCLGCSEACNGEFRIKEGRFNDVAQIVTFAKSIGKTIFLTEEEAERALEEACRKNT